MIIIGLPWGRQEGFSLFQILLLMPFNAIHIPQHREQSPTPANTPTPLPQLAALLLTHLPMISHSSLYCTYDPAASLPIQTSHLLTGPERPLLTLLQDSVGNPYLSSFPHSLTWQCLSSHRTASLTANSLRPEKCASFCSHPRTLSHTLWLTFGDNSLQAHNVRVIELPHNCCLT